MKSPRVQGPALAGLFIALSVGLAVAPIASADPTDSTDSGSGTPAPAPAFGYSDNSPVTIPVPSSNDAAPAAVTACPQFGQALDGASTFYGDFADSIEGTERPDYSDPTVSTTNTSGRTALREAAALALSSAGTPGLQPEIADPMRSWSMGATKLLLKMAVRTSGESMNQTATQMNTDASNAQMACASAGARA